MTNPAIERTESSSIEFLPLTPIGNDDISKNIYGIGRNSSTNEGTGNSAKVDDLAAHIPLSESPGIEAGIAKKDAEMVVSPIAHTANAEAGPSNENKLTRSHLEHKKDEVDPDRLYVSPPEGLDKWEASLTSFDKLLNKRNRDYSNERLTPSEGKDRSLQRSFTEPVRRIKDALLGSDKSSKLHRENASQKVIYEQLLKEYQGFMETPYKRAVIEKIKSAIIDSRNKNAQEFAEHFDETLSVKSVLHMAELNRDILRSSGFSKTPEFLPIAEKLDEMITKLGSHYQNFRDITRRTMTHCVDLGDYAERRAHFDINARLYIDQVKAGKNYGLGANPDGSAAQAELSFGYSLPNAPGKAEYKYDSDATYFSRTILPVADTEEFRATAERITQDIREGKFSRPLPPVEPPFQFENSASDLNPQEGIDHPQNILQIWTKIDNLGPEELQDAINRFINKGDHAHDITLMREEISDLLQDQIDLGNFIIAKLKEKDLGQAAGKTALTAISDLKIGEPTPGESALITDENVASRVAMVAQRSAKYVDTAKAAFNEVLRDLETHQDSVEKRVQELADQMFSETIKYKELVDKSSKAIKGERKYLADRGMLSAIQANYATIFSGGLAVTIGVGALSGFIGTKISTAEASKQAKK